MRRSAGVLLALVGACSPSLVEPAPTLTSVTPSLACAGAATTTITIRGTNLTPLPVRTLAGGVALALPSVTLDEAPIALAVAWQSEEQMTFALMPASMLPSGVYGVSVANPDGKTATLPAALGLLPSPSVTTMPPAICDSPPMDRTVTLAGQGFLVVGTTQPQVEILDGTGAVVLTATATTASCKPAAALAAQPLQLCTTLTFVVPKNALAPGSYTVRVVDPAPASCASSEPITLTLNRGNC